MITLFHHPLTHSLWVRWLLEELDLDYALKPVKWCRPTNGKIIAQLPPTGRLPMLADGYVVLAESGAIAHYLLERYGQGRLAPPVDSPLRGSYLQWMHFPKATVNPYIKAIRRFQAQSPAIVANLSAELDVALSHCDRALAEHPYIVGDEFTSADIMLAVSLLSIHLMGLLTEKHTHIADYFYRWQTRPAFTRALQNSSSLNAVPFRPVYTTHQRRLKP